MLHVPVVSRALAWYVNRTKALYEALKARQVQAGTVGRTSTPSSSYSISTSHTTAAGSSRSAT